MQFKLEMSVPTWKKDVPSRLPTINFSKCVPVKFSKERIKISHIFPFCGKTEKLRHGLGNYFMESAFGHTRLDHLPAFNHESVQLLSYQKKWVPVTCNRKPLHSACETPTGFLGNNGT